MSEPLSNVLSKETLEEIGKEFFEQTKSRLKDFWETYPEQTKKDIEDTAKLAATLAAKLAIGDTGPGFDRHMRHLNAQVKSIQVLGAFALQLQIDNILDSASRLAGTFLQKVVQQALTGATGKTLLR